MREVVLDAGGQRVHAVEAGEGPPVLLIHSSGMSWRQWKRLIERFEPTRRCVALDLAGYGGSVPWKGPPERALEGDLEVVEAVAAWVGEPVHCVAHSYGGVVALRAAALGRIAVESMVVYEPVVFGLLRATGDEEGLADLRDVDGDFFREELAGTDAWFRAFVGYWNGPGAWDVLPEDARRRFSAAGRKTFDEVRALTLDTTGPDAYRGIEAPALVLVGERTREASKRTSRILADALPHATLEAVPGAGHLGPVTHADAVVDRIASFYRRVSTRDP